VKPDSLLATWIRRFLLEYVVKERNLSINTQCSYRDTMMLLLQFAATNLKKQPGDLAVLDLSKERLQEFLTYLEQKRSCSVRTRNQRLCAIHSLARFIEWHSPEHIVWATDVRAIPTKKGPHDLIPYLEKVEMDALLEIPDSDTVLGRRDYALLLFLYNSGCRADEAAQLHICDLDLQREGSKSLSIGRIVGKGRKVRQVPLWPKTVEELRILIGNRSGEERVFLNRRAELMTRFGIYSVVKRHAAALAKRQKSVARKRVSPHTVRHTAATHLLRAGVDLNTIRAWLGHVSIDTTNIYAEVDFETKAKALALCEVSPKSATPKAPPDIVAFLKAL
jgi:site-specific recombinase XerD